MIHIKIIAVMEMAIVLKDREKKIILPENALVSDLLLELEKKYGEPMTRLLYGSNRNLEHILLVNGRSIHFLQGMDTVLKDGDEIFLLPAIVGG